MKRVLMVSCEGLGNGGVQSILMGIVRCLSQQFVFDALLFTSETRHYDDEFLSFGGNIYRIPQYEGRNVYLQAADTYVRDIYIYKKALALLKHVRYDVVHCHREFESAPILRAAKEVGVPVRICHSHVINQRYNPIKTWLNRQRQKTILQNANYLLGCSIESCTSLYGSNSSYTIMNNFYDDKKFFFSSPRIENQGFILTQVGAIFRIKNQAFSVKVLDELIKQGIQAKLNIIGFDRDPAYKEEVMNLICEKGLTEQVIWLPGDSDIPSLLSQSSAFIMPSLHEGFGIAMIEAQAMRLQCFASSCIPSATNCGGVIYLDLEDGPKYWASCIIKNMKKDIGMIDTSAFKQSNILRKYEAIYNSKI